jgi:predicted nucleic acid-binding protein
MLRNPVTSHTLVIDANIAISLVVPAPLTAAVRDTLRQWIARGDTLVAPSLWLAEATSVIRGYVHSKQITPGEGRGTLESLFALPVRIIPDDESACRSAYGWAELLGQARAYDGFYLALAQRLDAPFFTADQRLVNRGRQLGLTWILGAGDAFIL